VRERPRKLSGQSGTGTAGSIITSGWVIKNTVGKRSSHCLSLAAGDKAAMVRGNDAAGKTPDDHTNDSTGCFEQKVAQMRVAMGNE
jgi:hypothetical protein